MPMITRQDKYPFFSMLTELKGNGDHDHGDNPPVQVGFLLLNVDWVEGV